MQRRHFRFAGLALGGALLFPAVAQAADDGSSATTSLADAAPAAGTETGRFRLEPAMGVKSAMLLFDLGVRAATFVDGEFAFRFGASTYRPSLGLSLGSIVTERAATATALLNVCPLGFRFAAERVRLSACFLGGVGASGSAGLVGPVWIYGMDFRSRFYIGKLASSDRPSTAFYAELGLGSITTELSTVKLPTMNYQGEESPAPVMYVGSVPSMMSAFTAAFAFGVEFR